MILRIIIFVIIILVVSLLLIYFVNKKPIVNTQIENYSDIKNKFKTGDIILFSCRKHNTFIDEIKYFSRTKLIGSEFGHVGLILRDKKKLYVIEFTDYEHPGDQVAKRYHDLGKGGMRVIELETALREYNKDHMGCYAVRFISQEIPNDIFYDKIKKHRHKIFESKPKLLLLAFIDMLVMHKMSSDLATIFHNEDRMTCGEFVHTVLNDCNAVADYPSKIFWPYIVEDSDFNKILRSDISYSRLVKFIFDP
ncbi:hypothetical protein qu_394 [Acanthamoeba polyphaga mimivirus]|nr:hypothetical protein [Mimivirus reunion]WMV61729.1 hypothetical protein qu_394 [Mimivirus sp.]WMV62706.1 hypothetical protein qu_394 [Acanthamoeba polyphaga mimivirus]WMV63683.1 hypothetical protein qu_394 [Mimivirus sp.]